MHTIQLLCISGEHYGPAWLLYVAATGVEQPIVVWKSDFSMVLTYIQLGSLTIMCYSYRDTHKRQCTTPQNYASFAHNVLALFGSPP